MNSSRRQENQREHVEVRPVKCNREDVKVLLQELQKFLNFELGFKAHLPTFGLVSH